MQLASTYTYLQKELAEVLISEFEGKPQLQGGLEGVCRILLVADAYNVVVLRDHCLHRLAARFNDLAKRTAPLDEQKLFLDFLASIMPKVLTALWKTNLSPMKDSMQTLHYRLHCILHLCCCILQEACTRFSGPECSRLGKSISLNISQVWYLMSWFILWICEAVREVVTHIYLIPIGYRVLGSAYTHAVYSSNIVGTLRHCHILLPVKEPVWGLEETNGCIQQSWSTDNLSIYRAETCWIAALSKCTHSGKLID